MRERHALLLVTMALFVSGCSLFQPTPPPNDSDNTGSNCHWEEQRGIAELLRFDENDALMAFFPGDIRFRVPADNRDWKVGDEFKVVLVTAKPTDCAPPQVETIKPLKPEE